MGFSACQAIVFATDSPATARRNPGRTFRVRMKRIRKSGASQAARGKGQLPETNVIAIVASASQRYDQRSDCG
jgi:hypothetical protein